MPLATARSLWPGRGPFGQVSVTLASTAVFRARFVGCYGRSGGQSSPGVAKVAGSDQPVEAGVALVTYVASPMAARRPSLPVSETTVRPIETRRSRGSRVGAPLGRPSHRSGGRRNFTADARRPAARHRREGSPPNRDPLTRATGLCRRALTDAAGDREVSQDRTWDGSAPMQPAGEAAAETPALL